MMGTGKYSEEINVLHVLGKDVSLAFSLWYTVVCTSLCFIDALMLEMYSDSHLYFYELSS